MLAPKPLEFLEAGDAALAVRAAVLRVARGGTCETTAPAGAALPDNERPAPKPRRTARVHHPPAPRALAEALALARETLTALLEGAEDLPASGREALLETLSLPGPAELRASRDFRALSPFHARGALALEAASAGLSGVLGMGVGTAADADGGHGQGEEGALDHRS